MTLPTPYWTDGQITLYHGDALDLLPRLQADAIVTDPPYGDTSLDWDRWRDFWPDAAVEGGSPQIWCFGSLRMFLEKFGQFERWKLAQDIVWEKHNGSNPHNDRFRRVHELAVHFYRGEWSKIHKEPQFTNDATARTVRRKRKPPQWGDIGAAAYASDDGGPRLTTSVLSVRSCHGTAIHPTQKPEGIVTPLVLYSVPHGGTVLDPFSGSGTTLAVARKTGRRAIGIELREEYCEATVDRLSQQELLTC